MIDVASGGAAAVNPRFILAPVIFQTGDKRESALLLVGNHFRQWARVPTCGNRSVFGVGNYSFSRGALGACGAPSMKRLSV